ncbi:MAG TPA: hypothetical protein VFV02_04060 [Acidimicrobiales bacterium]|nr:hypothetical protein [Acidimicrobiales bacterium]
MSDQDRKSHLYEISRSVVKGHNYGILANWRTITKVDETGVEVDHTGPIGEEGYLLLEQRLGKVDPNGSPPPDPVIPKDHNSALIRPDTVIAGSEKLQGRELYALRPFAVTHRPIMPGTNGWFT